MCDDVVILSSGTVVAAGPAAVVLGQAKHDGIRIRVPSPSASEARHILEALPNVMKVTPTGDMTGWLRVDLVGPADGTSSGDDYVNNRILEALIRAEIPILNFEAKGGGRLQEVFLHLTEETIK